MDYFLELFLGGLTRGSIYALIALGYTMVYGIIELINFAHGEIYMIGAFTAFIVATVLSIYGFPMISIVLLAGLAAAVWSASYGYTVEKIAYRPLRHAPRLSPLISAIGMSIFLQNYVLLAQTSDFLPFPNLIKDFEDEISGYLNNFKISTELKKLNLKSGLENIPENLWICYEKLIEISLIEARELSLLDCWINDLKTFCKSCIGDK